MENEGEQKKKLSRNPQYPFISLKRAVERAESLHEHAKHHEVRLSVLSESWGYSEKSSGLAQTVSALLQYNLLEADGSGNRRRFKLTLDALRIVEDADHNSEKRKRAIERAALAPAIHEELWDKYGDTISDSVLINYLTLDRREAGEKAFERKAAENFISTYKETINYAIPSDYAETSIKNKSISQKSDEQTVIYPNRSPAYSRSRHGVVAPPPPYNPNRSSDQRTVGERVIFTDEESSRNRLRVMLTGEMNEYLLGALEDFVSRQRNRLQVKVK